MDVFDLKEGTARKILSMKWRRKKIEKREMEQTHFLCECVGVVDGEDSIEMKWIEATTIKITIIWHGKGKELFLGETKK
jgi:hypothetical protein